MVKPHSPMLQCKQSQSTPTMKPTCIYSSPSSCFSKTNKASVKRPRPGVTFSRQVACRLTTHRNDMKHVEKERYWLTEEDKFEIKKNLKACLAILNEHEERGEVPPSDCDNVCYKALEGHTKLGRKHKTANKESVRNAVFRQQSIQLQQGVFDPDLLATVSRSKSNKCAEKARQIAERDALEVASFHSTASS